GSSFIDHGLPWLVPALLASRSSRLTWLAVTVSALTGCGPTGPQGMTVAYPDPSSPDDEFDSTAPMTPSQDPQIQSQICNIQSCGNRQWNVNFVLPTPTPTSGWVVQKIDYTLTYSSSGGTKRRTHASLHAPSTP